MNPNVLSKSELMFEIERNWAALTGWIASLTGDQLTAIHDPQGWTVKDHLIHINRWEHWAISYLRGEPCYIDLGIEESLYRNGSIDAINAVIYQQTKGMPLQEVLAQLQETHHQLMGLLSQCSEAELQKPYHEEWEEKAPAEDRPTVANVLVDGTAHHYAEHLQWMKDLSGENE